MSLERSACVLFYSFMVPGFVFCVSGLTLKSLVYLEFIFEYDVGKYFNLILLHVIV